MANQYSISAGGSMQSSSINDSRRMYNFGERVAELAPQQSPFFVYLSKVAKKSTDDPVFKFLEQRHQWQRRNFQVKTEEISPTAFGDGTAPENWDHAAGSEALQTECLYDKYGRTVTSAVEANFFLQDQLIQVECKYASDGTNYSSDVYHATFKIAAAPVVTAGTKTELALTYIDLALPGTGAIAPASASKIKMEVGGVGQVIGSAFAEGGTDPEGWKDEMYDREGYVQIFKTAIPMFSGTAMATRYRGKADEYKRVWQEKLMEHKMDIEHAMLFGIGSDDSTASGPIRRSWGILPYTERYGKIKSFTYASSTYDDFLTAMEDIFAPESGNSGNKLVLASRKVITWLNKLGSESFLGNTVALGHKASASGGSNALALDVQNIKGAFGHNVSTVNTIYGNLHFVPEPLFRGMHEDYAVMIDLKNVAYRPLSGNGVSRDTHIITNVQNNNVDGRKDIVLTEAGLEIQLPETHAILKWA